MKRLCDCGGFKRSLPWMHQEHLSSQCMGREEKQALDVELEAVRDRRRAQHHAKCEQGNVIEIERGTICG